MLIIDKNATNNPLYTQLENNLKDYTEVLFRPENFDTNSIIANFSETTRRDLDNSDSESVTSKDETVVFTNMSSDNNRTFFDIDDDKSVSSEGAVINTDNFSKKYKQGQADTNKIKRQRSHWKRTLLNNSATLQQQSLAVSIGNKDFVVKRLEI